MTINAIGSGALSGVQGHPSAGRPAPPAMTRTAELLGMSEDDLRTAQRSGTTLADLAKQQGVSTEDLVATLATDLEAGKPEGAPELSKAQLTEMAGAIAEGRRPEGPGGPGGPGGPPPPKPAAGERADSNLTPLADALGVDPEALRERLAASESLKSLLGTATAATSYGRSATSEVRGGLVVDERA